MRPKRPKAPKRKKKIKRAGTREKATHRSMLRLFNGRLPGFSDLDIEQQLEALHVIRQSFEKYRKHKADPLAFWWHHSEIERAFGRGAFPQINAACPMFEVAIDRYYSGQGDFVTNRHETRAYRVMPDVERLYTEALHKKTRGRLGAMVDASGKIVRTLPSAVAAKDVTGKTAKVWRGEPVPQLVPVNLEALDHVIGRMRTDPGTTRDMFILENPEAQQYRLRYALELRKLGTTAAAGRGYIAHRYQEASTGRLSATGINLQSAPRTVRAAALVDQWDYDIENCHYAILYQMAQRIGHDCPRVAEYLADKEGTRARIMADIDLTKDQAKRALIALIYGARVSEKPWIQRGTNRGQALYEAVGKNRDKLRALVRHPVYRGLKGDLVKASTAILQAWPKSRGSLINEAGKGISEKEPKRERMAHLIQGVEAVMLRTALRMHPDKIVLLVHDGFVATAELDRAAIEAAVLTETGYRMGLAVKRLTLDADLAVPSE